MNVRVCYHNKVYYFVNVTYMYILYNKENVEFNYLCDR